MTKNTHSRGQNARPTNGPFATTIVPTTCTRYDWVEHMTRYGVNAHDYARKPGTTLFGVPRTS
jgi:hypothetical protein